MFRTIYFNAAVVEMVDRYAQEHGITFNKAVNEMIRRQGGETNDTTSGDAEV